MRMRPEKGFTLLEMLVYIAVLSLVMTLVLGLLLWVLRAQGRVAAMKEVAESSRAALILMESEIKEAQSLYTPTTTATQVSFATHRNPPAGEDITYIDFFLCDTRLCLKRESQAPIALTSENISIQNLNFTHVQTGDVPSVQVTFTAVYNNPGNRPELNATLEIQTTISQRTY